MLVVSDQFRHTVATGSPEAKRNGRKSEYSLETQMQRLGVCPVEFLDALERFLSRMKVQSVCFSNTIVLSQTHWQMVSSNGCSCYYIAKYAKRQMSAKLIAK